MSYIRISIGIGIGRFKYLSKLVPRSEQLVRNLFVRGLSPSVSSCQTWYKCKNYLDSNANFARNVRVMYCNMLRYSRTGMSFG